MTNAVVLHVLNILKHCKLVFGVMALIFLGEFSIYSLSAKYRHSLIDSITKAFLTKNRNEKKYVVIYLKGR